MIWAPGMSLRSSRRPWPLEWKAQLLSVLMENWAAAANQEVASQIPAAEKVISCAGPFTHAVKSSTYRLGLGLR